jgi:hypothetical protein
MKFCEILDPYAYNNVFVFACAPELVLVQVPILV